ncbi:hypothetical protein CRE_21622 [Caenorhabditis remanei]|uniref:CCHC-type domain-containing protein n=1 Tax=Caenorhabditis remanei TaxID=31234 RepID=E3NNY5_CAERE|nr:hypothetical protein CRE_21622 [Caenorhabditis remanei]
MSYKSKKEVRPSSSLNSTETSPIQEASKQPDQSETIIQPIIPSSNFNTSRVKLPDQSQCTVFMQSTVFVILISRMCLNCDLLCMATISPIWNPAKNLSEQFSEMSQFDDGQQPFERVVNKLVSKAIEFKEKFRIQKNAVEEAIFQKSRIVDQLRNKKETKDKLQLFQSLEDTRTKMDSALTRAQAAIRKLGRQSRTAQLLVETGVGEKELVDNKMADFGIDVAEERKSLEYLEQDVERERVEFSSLLKIGWKAVQQVSEAVELMIEEIQETSEAVEKKIDEVQNDIKKGFKNEQFFERMARLLEYRVSRVEDIQKAGASASTDNQVRIVFKETGTSPCQLDRSPDRRRSPSPVRRRSPSPVRRRSPSPVRGKSPSPQPTHSRRQHSPYEERNRHQGSQQGTGSSIPVRCVFCLEEHLSDTCRRYWTTEARRDRLHKRSRCTRCLRPHPNAPNHRCPPVKQCYYCNSSGRHHRSVCRQRPQ